MIVSTGRSVVDRPVSFIGIEGSGMDYVDYQLKKVIHISPYEDWALNTCQVQWVRK